MVNWWHRSVLNLRSIKHLIKCGKSNNGICCLPCFITQSIDISHFRLLSSDDPCLEGNYRVIAGQPQRSFNHHLSVGTEPPVCDSDLAEDWYRFQSPAGNLLPTECPGGNYCGTNVPVWMKGNPLSSACILSSRTVSQQHSNKQKLLINCSFGQKLR